MLAIRKAVDVWAESRRVAAQQAVLSQCPCCFAAGGEFLFDANDQSRNLFVAPGLKRGGYRLCHNCGTVFAGVRSRPEAAKSYYELFTSTQNGRYDVYPPVTVNAKRGVAKTIVQLLEERGLLQPAMAVLHVRCDSGTLLNLLRQRVADATLQGLDYFDTHVRYVREQGFAAAPLNPGPIEIPFDVKYDVVISNHQLTHAIEPRDYLERICRALKPDGHILFYNELDHDLVFDPDSRSYRRADVVNYHKQLFVKESFEALLSEAGLQFEYVSHRGSSMIYLARQTRLNAACVPVAPEVLERQRRQILAWQKVLRLRRPVVAAVHTLRWLARRDVNPDDI